MKKYIIISCLLLSCAITSMAQDSIWVDKYGVMEQLKAIGLPIVIINTVNNEEPKCDIISAPPGENGITHTNANKVPGRLQIIQGDDCLYDSGEYVEDESGMKMRIRGNTSAQWAKKPFKISLQKKADLLMRGNDDKYKDKDWLLLSGYGVNHLLGFYVNELVGLPWTPQYTPVLLVVNNDFRGTYNLIESVKRNTKCRLNVSDTGFIFERDPYWWNEEVYFQTNTSHEYTFKYPKAEDVTSDQLLYLRDYMNSVEQSFTDGSYPDYIDVESFASWVLGQDILSSWDCAGSNMYITKYDDTPDSKIMMANMWDFDMACRMPSSSWARVHYEYFYYKQLFDSPNKEFTRVYKNKWNELYPTLKNDIFQYMRNYCNSIECHKVDDACIWDMRRWGYVDGETLLKLWDSYEPYLTNHFMWLNQNINTLPDTDNQQWAGINDINAHTSTDAIYDLQGRRLNTIPEKGIYILNGRKIIK